MWQDSNLSRLRNKILHNTLPQNLKYGSIPAFNRLRLITKFFCFGRLKSFCRRIFYSAKREICSKADALQKRTQSRNLKDGERNRGRFKSCHTRQTRIIRTRPKRRISGIFSLVVFVRRQPHCILRIKIYTKMHSFWVANFLSSGFFAEQGTKRS